MGTGAKMGRVVHMVIPLAVLKLTYVTLSILVGGSCAHGHTACGMGHSYNFTNYKSDSLAVNGQRIAFYVVAAIKLAADKSNCTCQPSFILLHYV